MLNVDTMGIIEQFAKPLSYHDRTMLSTGAPDANHQMRFALFDI